MCAQPEVPLEGARRFSPYGNAPRLPPGDSLGMQQILAAPAASAGAGPVELELEIGPGRGGFLYERLASSPEVRIVGLEIRLKWASLVDQRLHELGLAERGR